MRRANDATFLCLLLVGAGLRLQALLDGRSLWVDEARLAWNLVDRPLGALLEPLSEGQAAPPGFLGLQRLLLVALGPSEVALRLGPLVCGLVALVLFALLVRRLLRPAEATLALALFALSEPLVYYSAELKPYMTDVMVALVLAWATLCFCQRPGLPRLGLLVGVVALGPWLSSPALFGWVGTATGVLASRTASRQLRTQALLALAVTGVLSFGLLWNLSLAEASASGGLRDFWSAAFAPVPPTSLREVAWWGRITTGLFADPGGLAAPGVGALLLLVGAAAGPEPTRTAVRVGLVPLATALGASVVELYPFPAAYPEEYPWNGRVLLFAVPALHAGVAFGAGCVARQPARAMQTLAAGAALLLVAPLAFGAISRALDPPKLQEMRPIVEWIDSRARAEDAFWVGGEARPAFRWYADRVGLELEGRMHEIAPGAPWRELEGRVAALGSGQRLWVVFAHHPRWATRSQERFLATLLAGRARLIARKEAPGARAVLFRVRPNRVEPPSAPPG